jgi:selenocysteine lyase/cysteine desulfurase
MNHVFPVLDHYTYLNTPSHGLLSTELVNYRSKLTDQMLKEGSVFTDTGGTLIHEVRTTVAHFLDAPVHLTALVPNFSLAFNSLMEDIDKNASFLLLQGDYPSVNSAVESRGFRCHYATIDDQLEHNVAKAVQQHKPDYLCLSLVQYISGIKIGLDFLKQLKQDYPSLVIIADATQYIGVEQFSFSRSGIDIIAASCYKWLHAGNGNAFVCFKEEVVEQVRPKFTAYTPGQDFTNQLGTFMGHFEPGHQDVLAFGSLKKAIEIVQSYGLRRIEKEIAVISLEAKEEFSQRNLLDKDVVARNNHSSIFNLKGGDALFKKLQEEKILCAQRGSGIRVGFSHFNTSKDLKKLLLVIDSF